VQNERQNYFSASLFHAVPDVQFSGEWYSFVDIIFLAVKIELTA
jgi:hypothetical protein